ncbi:MULTISPECIES: M24 family metallopeptidase [Haloferax]|uniref:Metallopeptidase family M24 n=1 Tax=Haloferax massiliensis TaxID=1476858 RepID=A0A0D6JW95_9EURY|nr:MULTISPECIES: M24 family metallopeptidase [Haloferax]MDS0240845.1 M24 family metallopeptidase [Haloferax sp. S2CR25]MDS0443966.1 M24 family metallopeptidase [Haloferax sp. S2CR25-2]CQR53647.1 Metallopeptidase family M24 [Haloferax massiliensis]
MDERLDSRADRLDGYLDDNGLEAVWFARPNSFAWLLGGDSVVDRDSPLGVAAAGYDGDEFHVVTDNIEANRLLHEELPHEDVRVHRFQWYEGSLASGVEAVSPTPAAADFDVPGFEDVDAAAVRQPLSDADIEAYRELGRDAASAVERVCRELAPGDTEHEVASGLKVTLSAMGIEAPVVLVGGARRVQKYRHYTPKQEELGDYALVSVTAQRGGLYASCTRTVAFDAPEWLETRHEGAMRVETEALAATRKAAAEGGTAGDVFDAIRDAYDAVGESEEWLNHHQGGAAGFAGREWFATPDADDEVRAPMGYAYNPTIQGAKSEGTALVTDEGVEPLTATGRWPTRTVTDADETVELERPEILHIETE